MDYILGAIAGDIIRALAVSVLICRGYFNQPQLVPKALGVDDQIGDLHVVYNSLQVMRKQPASPLYGHADEQANFGKIICDMKIKEFFISK